MNLTLKERLDLQRTARIITESQYNKVLKEGDGAQKINNFIKGVKSAGIDTNNNKVQLDILNKFIDADFDIDSLNPEEINEYNESLEENKILFESEILLHGLEALETYEVGEQGTHLGTSIMHKMGFSNEQIKSASDFLKKLIKYSPIRLVEKAFFKIARLFGADIETASIVGNVGLALFAVGCIAFSIAHFPSIISIVSAAIAGGSIMAIVPALMKLFWAIMKSASSIFSLWKNATTASKESSSIIYTSNDFLKDIESAYKKSPNSKGKQIPTNWIYDLKDWYNHLKKEDQPLVSKALKDLSIAIISDLPDNKKISYYNILKKFKHDNEDVYGIFDKIMQSFLHQR